MPANWIGVLNNKLLELIDHLSILGKSAAILFHIFNKRHWRLSQGYCFSRRKCVVGMNVGIFHLLAPKCLNYLMNLLLPKYWHRNRSHEKILINCHLGFHVFHSDNVCHWPQDVDFWSPWTTGNIDTALSFREIIRRFVDSAGSDWASAFV